VHLKNCGLQITNWAVLNNDVSAVQGLISIYFKGETDHSTIFHIIVAAMRFLGVEQG
jgi:hypothetical protein